MPIRKRTPRVTMVYCQFCEAVHGEFLTENTPKRFICAACGVGQKTEAHANVGFKAGRNATGHYLSPTGGRKR